MSAAQRFDADGVLVTSEPTSAPFDAVSRAFAQAGFEDLAPKARTEYESLKEAVSILKRKDQKIERHKSHEKNGCELMQVSRDADENGYERQVGAKVTDGRVVFDRWHYDSDERVQDRYNTALTEVPSRELSNALVSVFQKLNGKRMRQKGALWFIPAVHADELYALVDALEPIGVDVAPFQINLDERACRYIAKTLTAQMTKAAEKLTEDVASLKTPEAIERKKTEAIVLQAELAQYVGILGKNMEEAQKALELAQTAAMIAAMQAMAGEVAAV
jgi:hypothetical protein